MKPGVAPLHACERSSSGMCHQGQHQHECDSGTQGSKKKKKKRTSRRDGNPCQEARACQSGAARACQSGAARTRNKTGPRSNQRMARLVRRWRPAGDYDHHRSSRSPRPLATRTFECRGNLIKNTQPRKNALWVADHLTSPGFGHSLPWPM